MIIKTDKLDYLGSQMKNIYFKNLQGESELAHFFFIDFHFRTICNGTLEENYIDRYSLWDSKHDLRCAAATYHSDSVS